MATYPWSADGVPVLHENYRYIQDLLRLQKAAQTINSTLDLDVLLTQVVNDVAQSFGCIEASIWLRDAQAEEVVLAGVRGCSVHKKGSRLKVGVEGMVGHVAATGEMRYAPDVRLDPYYIGCEHDTRSEVDIPLKLNNKVIGVFSAVHNELDAFSPEQLELLKALAGHIAVAVENARRFQEEREAAQKLSREADEARTIQQALFPKSSPLIPGFAVEALSVPAGAVGGDWYDYIDLGNERWGFVLADVSGKGPAAALLMSATRATLRSIVQNCPCSPGESLAQLNDALMKDFPSGRYVTMVYGVLDRSTRELTFANAGHPFPMLVGDNDVRFLETDTGLPLGLGSSSYSESSVLMPPGAMVAFYSDGITEATNSLDEDYGGQRLARHVARPQATPESLLRDVRAFAGAVAPGDDATVIFLRAKA
ncbi:MAG TPA: GAF domain-containing SpoIIE family protein phosphatase [Terriglobales bacterium]|nr:GAF domain-containing SpoIIE family protein phosphatase [Terriglobales bacterium]